MKTTISVPNFISRRGPVFSEGGSPSCWEGGKEVQKSSGRLFTTPVGPPNKVLDGRGGSPTATNHEARPQSDSSWFARMPATDSSSPTLIGRPTPTGANRKGGGYRGSPSFYQRTHNNWVSSCQYVGRFRFQEANLLGMIMALLPGTELTSSF